MKASQKKVLQYLGEAEAAETALVRVLQSQIAMTPRGPYRTALERHLGETRDHATRIAERRSALGHGGNPLTVAVGVPRRASPARRWRSARRRSTCCAARAARRRCSRTPRTPARRKRSRSRRTRAIERLARAVGDEETATLAASIRADEEKMLERVLREIPKLTDAVVRAEVKGDPSFEVSTTGAADAVREAGEAVDRKARATGTQAKRTARQARKVPGVARAEGEIKGAVASADDLAIARYDTLTAEEIAGRLAALSQIDLCKVDAYERKNQNRSTVLTRIETLRGDEPWTGYDELTAAEAQAALADADDDRARQVRAYERAHKNRAGVLRAAERELAAV